MMLQIRNMESFCCLKVVKDELCKIGIQCKSLELGRIELTESVTPGKLQLIDNALRNVGLEILSDSKTKLVEKVKKVIYQLVYHSDNLPKQNFSDIIRKEINLNYTYVSSLFSSVVGMKIEKYIIARKIDRVKELLVDNRLNIIEITYLMKYSSVAHLSNQFKKVTGMTPASYRQLGNIGEYNTGSSNSYLKRKL